MGIASRPAVWLWLAAGVIALAVALRSPVVADLSGFLPDAPLPSQKILIEQLRDGPAARMVLLSIEGGDEAARAQASRALATRLRGDPQFVQVANGEPESSAADRKHVFENRYLLSDGVTPEAFSAAGLRESIRASIEGVASGTGMLSASLLASDPTGETLRLIDGLAAGAGRPRMVDGTWASGDGKRAILLLRLAAGTVDTVGQQRALQTLQSGFVQVQAALSQGGALQLRATGPAVFTVESRERIQHEVTWLGVVSTTLVVLLMLALYRSLRTLALGTLPVLTGVIAGWAAVSASFGMTHALTLGFGVAMIGEAADYAIYLFMQADGGKDRGWRQRWWPTIRLGLATSVAGFATLVASSFPGLAQLGLFTITGLVAAALTTRFVLPQLLPADFRLPGLESLGRPLLKAAHAARRLRGAVFVLLLAALAVIAARHDQLWSTEASVLSPVPMAAQQFDAKLRADLGAPDVRYIVAVLAPDRERALQGAERVGQQLQRLVDAGVIGHFENPARLLPSVATQRARQAALPAPGELQERLGKALQGLPLQPARLDGFVQAVEKARTQAPLPADALQGTALAMAVDGLLVQRPGNEGWLALLPIGALPSQLSEGAVDAPQVRAALAAAGTDTLLLDMKVEIDTMYGAYLQEAVYLSLAGAAAVLLLLAASLRSMRRLVRVVAPLAAAVLCVIGLLVALGVQMTLLHLVGLLLTVAIGSNYALLFDRGERDTTDPQDIERLHVAVTFASLTTLASFGVLAFSSVPVLSMIGSTVAPGVVLSLLFAAALAPSGVHAE
jgi:predicted exporter